MKKQLCALAFVLSATLTANAQTKIKDGTINGSSLPDTNAILELESNNKGLLLPRIELDSTGLAHPLTAHTAGMTVYNTATAADVSPGYYYNDGTKWVRTTQDYKEPWNVCGTFDPADNNTQDIYQLGNVGIGVDPGSFPIAKLQVFDNITTGGTGISSGIFSQFYSNKNGAKYGLYSSLIDNSATNTGLTSGLYSTLTAAVPNSTTNNIYGINNTVNYSNRNFNQLYTYVAWPTITASASDVTGNWLRAYNTILYAQANTGRTLTITGDIKGAQLRVTLQGEGTVNSFEAIGADGAVYTSGNGTRNITYGAGLRSQLHLPGTTANNVFTDLYGLHIDVGAANATPANAYGIFIDAFCFAGDDPATAYNLYSQGANTKNFFQGRVGIGINAPTAQLHVVKQASDLTPAIIAGCNVYADNAAATAAGLPVGGLYRTSDGTLKIVY